jgi:predicted alpha/beta superfamily hydrolase
VPNRSSLTILPDIVGPGTATRDLLVALPPGYSRSRKRYPVVYLQDGQNLFDPATAFAGHWSLLETLTNRGMTRPVVLVGVPNLGPGRLREYSPFDDPVRGIGEGVGYLEWLIGTVKPLVDQTFRTKPERHHTAVGGSSMGGLFATYALIAGAATFGAAWAMSPAYWYADGRVYTWLARQPAPVGRLWLDVGVLEGEDELLNVRRMRDLLIDRGWSSGGTLHYHEDPSGDHDEASWGRRVDQHWSELTGMLG